MKVFLVDIRTTSNDEEYQMGYDVITTYFKNNGIEWISLNENLYGCHPSWLKLTCFNYTDDDFILCWDLDLLPKKNCPSIIRYLDTTKINLAWDSSLILKNRTPFIPEFRYNCGLMGIPISYKKVIDDIFELRKTSSWPSWEQYHINKWLAERNYEDVYELDNSWNCHWHPAAVPNHYILSAKAVHFTGLNVDSENRKNLIRYYNRLFFQ